MPGHSGNMFPYGKPDGVRTGVSETDFADCCRLLPDRVFGTAVFVGFCVRLSVNNSYKPFQGIKGGQSGVKVLTK